MVLLSSQISLITNLLSRFAGGRDCIRARRKYACSPKPYLETIKNRLSSQLANFLFLSFPLSFSFFFSSFFSSFFIFFFINFQLLISFFVLHPYFFIAFLLFTSRGLSLFFPLFPLHFFFSFTYNQLPFFSFVYFVFSNIFCRSLNGSNFSIFQ
ncbi:unnamed protein product [Acanthosepion pharaonis]|uniref:Uncharacterized protein n=1 Tax=Acanthosepion pharaonis TaxID=158019 RepID=A0A812EK53_ACAPH|nr:unnamed protein product [Sepia pharaonis]